jgi:hypothetical protein
MDGLPEAQTSLRSLRKADYYAHDKPTADTLEHYED